jgi:hypothetical protein
MNADSIRATDDGSTRLTHQCLQFVHYLSLPQHVDHAPRYRRYAEESRCSSATVTLFGRYGRSVTPDSSRPVRRVLRSPCRARGRRSARDSAPREVWSPVTVRSQSCRDRSNTRRWRVRLPYHDCPPSCGKPDSGQRKTPQRPKACT